MSMKPGDMVVPQPFNELQEKFNLYRGESTPFDVKWLKDEPGRHHERKLRIGDVAIVLTSYAPNTGGVFYKVVTSSGEVGWAHENWLRLVE